MRWDLFCRVVDNWGDAGVCWRLAADLAARGERVRLWIDDPSPLRWMAPQGRDGVDVVHWTDPAPDLPPADAVVEAFGCDPPARFVERLAAQLRPATWINLEYLSAERYAVASHGLPSPQSSGPGRGLTKWFYFPGFGEASGGLLRERGLLEARATFDRDAWLRSRGIERAAGERVVTLFCYDNAALPALLERLAAAPTLLLVTAGKAAEQVAPLLDARLRSALLPLLPQLEFDRLLWASDLNFVRGEDSLVRAIWAGTPFVWQIYPQHDGVHARKLQALLDLLLAEAEPGLAASLHALWQAWNGLEGGALRLPPQRAWHALVERWRDRLAAQPDLTTRLLRFVAAKR
jgi:uncharacterized repeat protein (TIGR03837 family)